MAKALVEVKISFDDLSREKLNKMYMTAYIQGLVHSKLIFDKHGSEKFKQEVDSWIEERQNEINK